MFKKILLLLLGIALFGATPIHAENLPNFGTCPNPGGSNVASYSDGNHGIPGDYSTHTGSDNVFQINDSAYTQCFCPTDPGMGMQTNWINVAGFPQSQIDALTNVGGIYIGNGADWGLTADPYIAINDPIQCGTNNPQAGGLGGGNGNTGSISAAAASTTSNTPQVSGQVLGLAATGNDNALIRIILAVIVAIGIFFVILL